MKVNRQLFALSLDLDMIIWKIKFLLEEELSPSDVHILTDTLTKIRDAEASLNNYRREHE